MQYFQRITAATWLLIIFSLRSLSTERRNTCALDCWPRVVYLRFWQLVGADVLLVMWATNLIRTRGFKMIFRYLPVCFTALFFGLAFSDAAVAQININLPEGDTPVVRIDERYTEEKKDKRPMLMVYSDGRVVRSISDNKEDDYEFTLSKEKFEKFLKAVFVDNEFETILEGTIENTLSPRRPARNSFRVSTNTADGSHVVNFGDTWLYDRLGQGRKRAKYQKAEHLHRFLRVEDACRKVANLALIGGEEAFQDAVKKANMEFKKSYPDGPTLSNANLFSVRRGSDGKVAVRFRVGKRAVEPHPVSVWVKKGRAESDINVKVKVDNRYC